MNAQINFLNLNKRCEGWFMGTNAAAPICHGTPEVVGEAITTMGAEAIEVEARTVIDPKEVARDLRTFTKRLQRVATACGYVATPFVVNDRILRAQLVKG